MILFFTSQQFATLHEIENNYQIRQRLNESRRDLESRRKEVLYLIFIILLLAVLAAVIFRRYRSNKVLNEKLKSINESKDKLFSIIAHDLKNPFFTLMGYTDLLKNDDLTKDEMKSVIDDINKTTRNTYGLLENLLNLSASRTGKIDFSPHFFSITKLVNQTIDQMSSQLKEKRIVINTEILEENIYADEYMMEIVLRNLMTNALKYSYEKGSINIKVYRDNSNVLISVTDHGNGISPEIKSKLFTSDFIKSEHGTKGEKGTGLGLGLCKEFVEKHNGNISVHSESGKGTTFYITLTVKR